MAKLPRGFPAAMPGFSFWYRVVAPCWCTFYFLSYHLGLRQSHCQDQCFDEALIQVCKWSNRSALRLPYMWAVLNRLLQIL